MIKWNLCNETREIFRLSPHFFLPVYSPCRGWPPLLRYHPIQWPLYTGSIVSLHWNIIVLWLIWQLRSDSWMALVTARVAWKCFMRAYGVRYVTMARIMWMPWSYARVWATEVELLWYIMSLGMVQTQYGWTRWSALDLRADWRTAPRMTGGKRIASILKMPGFDAVSVK